MEQEEEHFQLFVSNVPDYAIFLLDAEGRVATWNAGAQRLKGYRAEEVVGRHYSLFFTPDDRRMGKPQQHLAQAAATGHQKYEGWRVRADGSRFYADVVLSAIFDSSGHLTGYGKVVRDVTERRSAVHELVHRSTHDVLTGLANRALLLDRLEHALERRQRHRASVGILFIDLDRFKSVNDRFGHEVGDHLLVAVAERLRRSVRPEDTVARLGGDEFVVLCEDLDSPRTAVAVAERVVAALAPPVRLREEDVSLAASIGVACANETNCDADTLLREADVAMYQAKAGEKAAAVRVRVFDPVIKEELDHRLKLEEDLRRALGHSQLALTYQPVVDLQNGHVLTYEALLRWRRDDGCVVDPSEFVPVAERSGLIRPLGAWVLEEACAQAGSWRQRYARSGLGLSASPGVAINVSAQQIDAQLVQTLPHILERNGLPPQAVCLEVTETSVMADMPTAVHVLGQLKDLGVSVAIDDFGTGYSSLSYLQRLPVDVVKIDRSFVAGLGVRRADSAIVAATVGMAQALGLSVVAEGVETRAQFEELRDLGCDCAQGWYFGRPQTVEALPIPASTSTPLPAAMTTLTAVAAPNELDLRETTMRPGAYR